MSPSTTTPRIVRFPYLLVTELHADCAPFALVEHIGTGARHRIAGGAAATLVYLLARKHLEDETAGVEAADIGWVSATRLMHDVWGLRGDDALERITFLIRVIQAELRRAGFAPGIIDERRGAWRVRAQRILVDGLAEVDNHPTDPGASTWDYDDDYPTDPMIILRKP